jgi:hypothetical protein
MYANIAVNIHQHQKKQ